MCLVTNKPCKVAEEDIIVYKILTNREGELTTYYQGYPVKIGVTYKSKLCYYNSEDYPEYGTVEEGLHSFQFLKEANNFRSGPAVIAECTIPKGSKYYEGGFDEPELDPSYASDTLTYNKILTKSKQEQKESVEKLTQQILKGEI